MLHDTPLLPLPASRETPFARLDEPCASRPGSAAAGRIVLREGTPAHAAGGAGRVKQVGPVQRGPGAGRSAGCRPGGGSAASAACPAHGVGARVPRTPAGVGGYGRRGDAGVGAGTHRVLVLLRRSAAGRPAVVTVYPNAAWPRPPARGSSRAPQPGMIRSRRGPDTGKSPLPCRKQGSLRPPRFRNRCETPLCLAGCAPETTGGDVTLPAAS